MYSLIKGVQVPRPNYRERPRPGPGVKLIS